MDKETKKYKTKQCQLIHLLSPQLQGQLHMKKLKKKKEIASNAQP